MPTSPAPDATRRATHGIPPSPLREIHHRSLLKDVWLGNSHYQCNGLEFVLREQQPAVFSVENPATGEPLAAVADQTTQHAQHTLATLSAEQPEWAATHPNQRARLLRAWFGLIRSHANDLARILTLEQGKPLAEAHSEVLYGSDFVQWYAEEARRIQGQWLHGANAQHRALVIQQPVGVCAGITPWNFPCAMVTRKIAPALAAGCTVALKPSELTPLSALALAQLAYQAGIPRHAFAVITSTDASGIGKVLCASTAVRHVGFTGSTATGRLLLQQCAPTIKKTAMELGGNAPFVVFEDADLDAAIDGLMACKFRNAGQACVAANRVYVQNSVHDDFIERLRVRMQDLVSGNGLDANVQLGPLIGQAAWDKVHALTEDALNKGASKLLPENATTPHPQASGNVKNSNSTGGYRGYFYPPTLLSNVTPDMQLVQQEIFGPVIAVQGFESEDQVIALANDTEYGLAAYFYTQNLARAHRVSEALECGMVGVNTGSVSSAHTPFGGTKQSGLGREGGSWGLEEYLECKYVNLGGL